MLHTCTRSTILMSMAISIIATPDCGCNLLHTPNFRILADSWSLRP
jgi:hypothetical protein